MVDGDIIVAVEIADIEKILGAELVVKATKKLVHIAAVGAVRREEAIRLIRQRHKLVEEFAGGSTPARSGNELVGERLAVGGIDDRLR